MLPEEPSEVVWEIPPGPSTSGALTFPHFCDLILLECSSKRRYRIWTRKARVGGSTHRRRRKQPGPWVPTGNRERPAVGSGGMALEAGSVKVAAGGPARPDGWHSPVVRLLLGSSPSRAPSGVAEKPRDPPENH